MLNADVKFRTRLLILLSTITGVSLLFFSIYMMPDLLAYYKVHKHVDFKIERITIRGAQGWGINGVDNLLKPYLGKNIFLSNTILIASSIKKTFPWVEKVKVRKIYPSELLVSITPREPCAIYENKGKFYVMDCSGKIIGIWKESLGIFPILSNIKGNFTDMLLFLKEAKAEGLYDLVSDLRTEGEEGDMVVLTIKGGVKVKFSRYDSPQLTVKKIKSVLYVAAKKGEKIDFVDLSGENARVRLKQ